MTMILNNFVLSILELLTNFSSIDLFNIIINLLIFSSLVITTLSLYHFSSGKRLKQIGQIIGTVGGIGSGYSGFKEIYKDIKGNSNTGGNSSTGNDQSSSNSSTGSGQSSSNNSTGSGQSSSNSSTGSGQSSSKRYFSIESSTPNLNPKFNSNYPARL
uniref:Uncharacterized protein n=1 Tax=Sphaerobolus stellatus TaxID=68786 RepID=A0A7D4ZB88_9AGAM|nr:hypothetical protein [Sphaerobolus stellatus]